MGKIVKCSCRHTFQDRYYDRGLRVTTQSPSKLSSHITPTHICTVCGKEHEGRRAKKEEKEEEK